MCEGGEQGKREGYLYILRLPVFLTACNFDKCLKSKTLCITGVNVTSAPQNCAPVGYGFRYWRREVVPPGNAAASTDVSMVGQVP